MKISPAYLLIPLFLTGQLARINGQEMLVSVGSYPFLTGQQQLKSDFSTEADTLELPFMDDFSGTSPYPSSLLWTDAFALVNNDFAIGQPTYGVATLDMMDDQGMIYLHATVQSFLADHLTSRPINLYYPQDTSIYLSFYFQPGGFGDTPEPDDSLAVEFYAPGQAQWQRVWSSPGFTATLFTQVMIQITDSRFLQNGFRFRFVNYASLANSYEPSLKVNADHWHIDYVYLNRNRHYQDTVMQDLSLLNSTGSLLLDYTALPWQHFSILGRSGVKTIFPIHLRNLSNQRLLFTPTLKIEEIWGSGASYQTTLAADEALAFEELSFDGRFNYGFVSEAADSALFRITLDLNSPASDWIPGNNLVSYDQVFTNYYAYDDGHPEAGYGLSGEGSKNGRIACRFQNLNAGDSLVGISMLFNQSFNRANRKFFRLAVWADDAGKPGTLIWSQEGAINDPEAGLLAFQDFLLDTAQVVPSFFHIGLIQTTADFLNIGFDLSTPRENKIHYNLGGSWRASGYEGSLMIRPLFANKSRKSGVDLFADERTGGASIGIYPNPASQECYFSWLPEEEDSQITILDNLGRTIFMSERMVHSVSVGSWAEGIYRVIITNRKRLTKQHSSLVVVNEY